MKIIDLLVRIANGEKIPKKIIFKNELYILKKWENIEETDYCCESTGNLLGDIYLTSLNEEVQIIEDTPKEDKKIKKLPYYSLEKIQKAKNKDEWIEERISLLEKRINDYHIKLNEIIDKINGE